MEAVEVFEDAGEEFEKLGKNISQDTLKVYQTALGKAKGMVEKTSEVFRNVTKKGARVLFMAMDTLWDFLNDKAKFVYIAKLGKKVEKFWKDRLDEAKKVANQLANSVNFIKFLDSKSGWKSFESCRKSG